MTRLATLVALATILVLASPVAARANSFDFDTGTFQTGKLTGSFQTQLNALITGSLNSIDLQTGPLTGFTKGCPPAAMCFGFTSGMVTVSRGGATEFTDSLAGGITIKQDGSASINAILAPGMGIKLGSATATFIFSGSKILSGSEDVSAKAQVPEPATLSLMGLGLCLVGTKIWRMRPAG